MRLARNSSCSVSTLSGSHSSIGSPAGPTPISTPMPVCWPRCPALRPWILWRCWADITERYWPENSSRRKFAVGRSSFAASHVCRGWRPGSRRTPWPGEVARRWPISAARWTSWPADVAAMSEAELLTHIGALLGLGVRFGDPGAAYVTVAMAFIQLFFRFTNRRLGRGGGELANRLLSGVSGLASAEAGLNCGDWLPGRANSHGFPRHLATMAAISPRSVSSWVIPPRAASSSIAGNYSCVATATTPAARWTSTIRAWCETPNHVLAMLRSHLGHILATDAADYHRPLAQRWAALANDCRRRLRNPLKIMLFDFLLRRAQAGVALRENVRNEMAR